MTNPVDEWSDGFGKQVSSTRNVLDLPSHYDITPERYRIKVNGTRTRPADTGLVVDNTSDFRLQPGAGDDITLYTGERPRYVVQYESEPSYAFNLNEQLDTGDTVEIGLRDYKSGGENKVYFEFNGESNRCVVEKEGAEVAADTFELPPNVELTNPTRPYIRYNWYGVGPYRFGLSYTDPTASDGEKQVNKLVKELVVSDEPSTSEANFHLYMTIDAANAGKELSAGSMGHVVLGTPSPTLRSKAARFTELSYGGSGEYEPILALRVDPNRENVFAEFTESEIVWNNGDGELLTISCPPDETDADFLTDPTGDGTTSGPVAPPQHNATNSVIQYTVDVTTFPDNTNTEVSTATDPGGYQIGFTASDAPQTGSGDRSTSQLRRKRPIHSDNTVVLLAKRDTSSSTDVNIIFETEQDW